MRQQRAHAGVPPVLNSMTGLAKSIALPHDFPPSRFPSFPSLERTATLGFSVPTTWTSTSVNSPNRFLLARQAGWPFWAELATTTTPGFYVDYPNLNHVPAVQQSQTATFGHITEWGFARTATTTKCGFSSGLVAPTCGYPILGLDGPGPEFVYHNNNGRIYFLLNTDSPNATGATATLELTVEIWVSPGEVAQTTLGVNGQATAANYGAGWATFSGGTGKSYWIRPVSVTSQGNNQVSSITVLSYFNSAAFSQVYSNTANVAVTVGTGASTTTLQPIVAPVEFQNSSLPWFATRTTAAAALLTNVTQVLNKAGTFLGGRVSPNAADPFNATTTYISQLHPAEKAQLAAEEGFYTFSPPSTDLVNFWDYTLNTSNGAAQCPVYRLDNDSLVNVFFHTDSVSATYSITVDWHLEFRTVSALFPIGVSTMPLEHLHQAQLALTQTGFFFNNWNHEKIRSIISNIAKYLGETTPMGRAMSFAYNVGRDLISSRKPKPNTQPTGYVPTGGQRQRQVVIHAPLPRARPPARGKGSSRKGGKPKGRTGRKGGLQMFLDSRK